MHSSDARLRRTAACMINSAVQMVIVWRGGQSRTILMRWADGQLLGIPMAAGSPPQPSVHSTRRVVGRPPVRRHLIALGPNYPYAAEPGFSPAASPTLPSHTLRYARPGLIGLLHFEARSIVSQCYGCPILGTRLAERSTDRSGGAHPHLVLACRVCGLEVGCCRKSREQRGHCVMPEFLCGSSLPQNSEDKAWKSAMTRGRQVAVVLTHDTIRYNSLIQ